MTTRNVADAKRQLSELLGRVAFGGETVLITRRGKPMARLVPVEATAEVRFPFAGFKGWLDNEDPFFSGVELGRNSRAGRQPRVLRAASFE